MRELILYIARNSEGDRKFGSVKLNKILFYADRQTFARLGKPITGQHYQKLERGPAPRCLVPVRAELEKDGAIAIRSEPTVYGNPLRRILALREPNTDGFSVAELQIVDQIIHAMWEWDGTEASDLSHNDVGWKIVAMNETIPYETVFIDSGALTVDEKAYARELVL
jgi:hypothetical protein